MERKVNFLEHEIYTRSWVVDANAPTVLLVHGMGEHCNRYAHVAEHFNASGLNVLAFDHIGHGKTTGQRGHVDDYDHLLETISVVRSAYKLDLPDISILYGHSMGGNVALNHLLSKSQSWKAAIISSPWLQLTKTPPKIQYMVGKLAHRILPKMSNRSKLDASLISRDSDEVRKYKEDELVHDLITPSFFFPIEEHGLVAIDNGKNIQIPICVFHGDDDQITSHAATLKMVENMGDNVTWKSWSGGYHELHNDPIREELLDYLTSWIKTTLQ